MASLNSLEPETDTELGALILLVENYAQAVVRCHQTDQDGYYAADRARNARMMELRLVLKGLLR